ncbi:MAG: hypothetical protein HS113_18115 [Verrucomicrobiales bacterium]|nr:hypothetical protein [Verrucomicrobiales bacterium]
MKPYWIPGAWRWAAGLLGASVLLSAAERPCAPVPQEIVVSWLVDPAGTCGVTNFSAEPVDLDGDGVADFRHERLRAEHHWRARQGQGNAYYYQDDEIEAYYPEAHVEMYVRVWSSEDVVLQDCKLAAGEMIEPEPPRSPRPYWTWSLPPRVRPAFEAHGVGIVGRRFERGGGDDWISGGSALGFLAPTNWYTHTQEGLFGIRLERAGGWHLGWLHLRWTWEWEWDPPRGRLEFLGAAVHPEPGKAIGAGEPARPELAVRLEGEEVVVSWGAVWEGYTLERSPALRPPAWKAVPDVSANAIRLPRNDAPAFFRLRR